jgi:hypothetical protein
MNPWQQNPATVRLKIDGAASATAFAAVTGARWVLQAGAIGWSNAVNSCTISLYEIDSTNSAPFFVFQTSATNGLYSFYLGDIGIQASSSYTSRMVLNTGALGTWSAMFTGYYVGQ